MPFIHTHSHIYIHIYIYIYIQTSIVNISILYISIFYIFLFCMCKHRLKNIVKYFLNKGLFKISLIILPIMHFHMHNLHMLSIIWCFPSWLINASYHKILPNPVIFMMCTDHHPRQATKANTVASIIARKSRIKLIYTDSHIKYCSALAHPLSSSHKALAVMIPAISWGITP